MKALLLSLLILAVVFTLSAALPEYKDRHSLLDSDPEQRNDKPLQRRRPPMKVPGPKLRKAEDEETSEKPSNSSSLTSDESKVKLSDEDRGKKKEKKHVNLTRDNKHKKDDLASLDDDSERDEKGKKRKEKGKDLMRRDEYNSDNEETQEERNSDVSGLIPKTEV